MKTDVTELPDSRVRVEVEVPAELVDRGVQRAARSLAREMRMPGFRKGKAPPSLVIQRLGFGAVIEEAVRDSLPEWYEQGLLDSGVSPVGDPKIEIVACPRTRASRSSSNSRSASGPRPSSASTRGSRSGGPTPRSPTMIVDARGRADPRGLRQARAGRAPRRPTGDVLLIDFEGRSTAKPSRVGKAATTAGARRRSLHRGFRGAAHRRQPPATSARSRSPSPTITSAEHLAGKRPSSPSTSRRCGRRTCPSSTTTSPPRPPSSTRSRSCAPRSRRTSPRVDEQRPRPDFRVAAVDAAAATARSRSPTIWSTLGRHETWERVERQLAGRGMSPESFAADAGQDREDVIEESRRRQARARREAVLAAVADDEAIEVTEEEMVEAIAHTAEDERTRRRSCSRGCARKAATRWSARTSRCARRSRLVAGRRSRLRSSGRGPGEDLDSGERRGEEGELWPRLDSPAGSSAGRQRLRRHSLL